MCRTKTLALAVTLALSAGCGGGTDDDHLSPPRDALDGGAPERAVDSSLPSVQDAGPETPLPIDAGAFAHDAGTTIDPGSDGGTLATDGGTIPSDSGVIDTHDCEVISDGMLDIDVRAVSVTGRLTVDGTRPAAGGTGYFYLRDPLTDDTAILGNPYDETYTARVIPGTYEVRYGFYSAWVETSGAVPNTNVLVRPEVVIGSDTTLDLDIATVALSVNLTLDGEPTEYTGGSIVLVNPSTGDTADVGSFPGPLNARVVPGVYDVHYRGPGGPLRNRDIRLRSAVDIRVDTRLDLDIVTALLIGDIETPAGPRAPGGNVYLRNPVTGDTADLGPVWLEGTGHFSYAARVVPGTYDLHYDVGDPLLNTMAVRNTNSRFQTGVIIASGETNWDINVPAIYIAGSLTVNGVVAESGGRIYLHNPATQDDVYLGFPNADTYTANIIPGLYEIHYRMVHGSSPVRAPRNERAVLARDVRFDMGGSFDYNVTAHRLTGNMTVNGGTFPDGGAHVALRDASGNLARLGWLSSADYDVLVIPGTYDLIYDGSATAFGHGGIRNRTYVIASGVVVDADRTMDVDITASTLEGSITVNGERVRELDGDVWLRRRGSDDKVYLGDTGDFGRDFEAWLMPGVYDVVYAYGRDRPLDTVRNTGAILSCVVIPSP